ncbi:hypothetical protein DNTS_018069 [Danionella cerebrum]|uniref:C2H2-type domain-containing protein n=1 Tax=Danionella cerebrum TaxID=2873325 RepID=A0A553QGS3_9TELE|nr:hypothetical protein DNTS_018069 [Danionella translucida]TRY89136.1 hypothetical protein DNTS_018069 [Danionella translucida]
MKEPRRAAGRGQAGGGSAAAGVDVLLFRSLYREFRGLTRSCQGARFVSVPLYSSAIARRGLHHCASWRGQARRNSSEAELLPDSPIVCGTVQNYGSCSRTETVTEETEAFSEMDLSMKSLGDLNDVDAIPLTDLVSDDQESGSESHLQDSHPSAAPDDAAESDIDHAQPKEPTSKAKRFQCSHCGKGFPRIQHLNEHVRTHTGEKPFQCRVCGKAFIRERNLKTHLVVHDEVKAFHCVICLKDFARLASLKRHQRAFHPGEDVGTDGKFLICVQCGRNFERELGDHELKHTGEISHRCPECIRSFSPSLDLSFDKTDPPQMLEENDRPFAFLSHEDAEGERREARALEFLEGDSFDQWNDRRAESLSELSAEEDAEAEVPPPEEDEEIAARQKVSEKEKPHQCAHCGKRFLKQDRLRAHLRVHTGEKPFRCMECGQHFSQAVNLKKHTLMHHTEEKQYQCTLCDLKFSLSFLLIKHQRVAHPENLSVADRKRFTCPFCSKIFGRHQDMEQHKRVHTGERPFRCPDCNKSFRQRSVLIVHRKIHTGEKPFECLLCSRRFYGAGDLKTHMGTHTGVRPHSCSICQKSFPRPCSLQAHMRTHEKKKVIQEEAAVSAGGVSLNSEKEEGGGAAGQSLLSENPGASQDEILLKRQSGSHRPRGVRKLSHEKRFECTHCGKKFSQQSMLRIHERIHTGEKPYDCPDCGVSFRYKRNLLSHMNAHPDQEPSQCPLCNQTFVSAASLKKHQDTFHTGLSHTCSLCLKIFTKSVSLRKHMLYVHEGLRRHQCPECGQGFDRLSELVRHQRGNHRYRSDQTFKCTQCESTFGHLSSLVLHRRTHDQERHQCQHCDKVQPAILLRVITEKVLPITQEVAVGTSDSIMVKEEPASDEEYVLRISITRKSSETRTTLCRNSTIAATGFALSYAYQSGKIKDLLSKHFLKDALELTRAALADAKPPGLELPLLGFRDSSTKQYSP